MDKDGELEAVRVAAAVVDLPGRPYAVTIMTTYLRRDDDGEAAIREISAALFSTFDRLARYSNGMLGRTPLLRDMVLSALTLATPVAHLDALTVVDATLGDDAGLVGASHLAASGVSLIPR